MRLSLLITLLTSLFLSANVMAEHEKKHEPSEAQLAQQHKMAECNHEAGAKALKGEERKSFMSNCLKKDSHPEKGAAAHDTKVAEHEKAKAEHEKAKAEHKQKPADHEKAKAEHEKAKAGHDKAKAEHEPKHPQHEKMKECNASAHAKHLKGEEHKTFMKECLKKAG